MARQPIVAGNWKMNGSGEDNQQLLAAINNGLEDDIRTQVLVFPPFIYIGQVANTLLGLNSQIGFGGQNISEHSAGAFTGEVSATMLTDLECTHVLVGHSERRSIYNETDEQIAEKFVAATSAGIIPVLCIGETLEERETGNTLAVIFRQIDAVLNKAGAEGLSKGIIAYEPVWAIGTGKTASPQQAQDVHNGIRVHLQKFDGTLANNLQILYGGSVNATNAAELFAMEDIDGGLIGGASLKADDFIKICVAAG